MSNETLVLLIVLVLLAGTLPSWPYSRGWGYGPSGLLFIICLVFLLWYFMGGRSHLASPGAPMTGHDTASDARQLGQDVADDLQKAGHEVQRQLNNLAK